MLSLAGYGAYLIALASGAGYVRALLWTVGASIVANIVFDIFFGGGQRKDQRDREIGRFGEHVGQALVVLGSVTALALAMMRADYFWIANAIYLGFVLSAVLSSVAKIVAYRRGFHPW